MGKREVVQALGQPEQPGYQSYRKNSFSKWRGQNNQAAFLPVRIFRQPSRLNRFSLAVPQSFMAWR